MNILITNDDGADAKGIKILAETLSSIGRVTVAAPEREKSGSSQSLTIHNLIRFKKLEGEEEFSRYAVCGSPADCVKIALAFILEEKPDVVVSGVNRGPNNAANILYSGTVGGAMEGAVNGIPSIAASLAGYFYEDYAPASSFVKKFILEVIKDREPKPIVYNINVPPVAAGDIKGVRFTQMSLKSYLVRYEKRLDPFNFPYYWLSDFRKPENYEKNTDDEALAQDCVSVTPLKIDRTDREELKELELLGVKKWF